MLRYPQILVSTIVLALSAVSLTACGQQGPLYLPGETKADIRTPSPVAPPKTKPEKGIQPDTQIPSDSASIRPNTLTPP